MIKLTKQSKMGMLFDKLLGEFSKAVIKAVIPIETIQTTLGIFIDVLLDETSETNEQLTKMNEQIGGIDRKLDRLLARPYTEAVRYLQEASQVNDGKSKIKWIDKAQEHFIAAASEGPSFLTIKAQFFNGVCYYLLGKGSDALRCYESAYNMCRLNPDIIFLSQFDISKLLKTGGSWIAFRMHHKEEFLKTYNKSKELLQFLSWLESLLHKRGVRIPYFYVGIESTKKSYDERGF